MSQDRLTKLARNRPCQIRLPGCDGGGETTVGCHYRLAGYCGTGIKPPSWMLAWGCNHCHSVVDGRDKITHGPSRDQIRLAHAEGVLRTLSALAELGEITL